MCLMPFVCIPNSLAKVFLDEKCLFEKSFKTRIYNENIEDGSIKAHFNYSKSNKTLTNALKSFASRKFSTIRSGNIQDIGRWKLMKKYGVYIENSLKDNTFTVFACTKNGLSTVTDGETLPERVELIVLDDSCCDDRTVESSPTSQGLDVIEIDLTKSCEPSNCSSEGIQKHFLENDTSTNADASIVCIGSFPGPPAKRRKTALKYVKIENETANCSKEEIINSLGLPYNKEEYSMNCRKPLAIAIDGCNVAREHGRHDNSFSCKGIKIAVDFFITLGHFPVRAFVPLYIKENARRCSVAVKDADILDELVKQKKLTFTPSREEFNGRMTVPYDDRFVLNYASIQNAVVLSNDRYRDIACESVKFAFIASRRLLMFSFAGDLLMIPSDPKGRYGPSLLEFLSVPNNSASEGQSLARCDNGACGSQGPANLHHYQPQNRWNIQRKPFMPHNLKRLKGSQCLTQVRRAQRRRRFSNRFKRPNR